MAATFCMALQSPTWLAAKLGNGLNLGDIFFSLRCAFFDDVTPMTLSVAGTPSRHRGTAR